MQAQEYLSGWDTFLVMTPIAALMVLAMFGLDDRLARGRSRRAGTRSFCEMDRTPLLRDPDGRPYTLPSPPCGKI